MQTESAGFTPTDEQRQREQSLQKFNRIAIYLPLGLFGLIISAIVIALMVGVISPGIGGTAKFVSGMADIVIIMMTVPMMLACAILPVGAIALMVTRQQKQKENPQPQMGALANHSRIQVLFWRLDSMIAKVQDSAQNKITPSIAKPVIRLNAFLAYISTLFNNLLETIYRRTENDSE